jgi:hypothetical protein
LTTEGQHQELKGRLGYVSNLSAEHESALGEKFPLFFDLALLFGQSEEFWGVFEFCGDADLLDVSIYLGIEFFSGDVLLSVYDFRIKEITIFKVVCLFLWRVTETNVLVKLEINESEKSCVEFHESTNHLVVDIKRQSLIETVRRNPGNVLAHELNLEVDTLDRQERFFEALTNGAIVHPFRVQFLSHFDFLSVD